MIFTGDLLQRINPAIVAFRHGALILADDLQRLQRVSRVEAPEAAVLYGGRILEVLSGVAVASVGFEADTNTFSNLITLEQFNLLPAGTRHWAHSLRRLANDARHVLRPMWPVEVDLTLILLERWLEWYFCRFDFGPRLGELWQGTLLPADDAPLRQLVVTLDSPTVDTGHLRRLVDPAQALWQTSPALPALVIEMLIERGEKSAANELLAASRRLHPNDLRLLQLHGLAQSRAGDLDGAWDTLSEAMQRFKPDDETLGIRGGIAKKLWKRDDDLTYLRLSHELYARGWKKSDRANPYLGINAATTALWLGQPDTARKLAGEVRDLLQERLDALKKHPERKQVQLGFWDEVTLAEAELLLGNHAVAHQRYREAFDRHAALKGNIDVAIAQAKEIMRHQAEEMAIDFTS